MNSFGRALRVTVFGQSHAPAIGAVIDGFPAGIAPDMDRIRAFMARRAPGNSPLSTARKEADEPRIVSGLNDKGRTCGAPIAGIIENGDAHSGDYDALRAKPRPGHSDLTAFLRWGEDHDIRGGGAFSGRLTAPLCFAGALCLQYLDTVGVAVAARIARLAGIDDAPVDPARPSLPLYAPGAFPAADPDRAAAMQAAILDAKARGDSVGGVIECFALGLPGGLGGPMFDGIENRLASALFAIPGVKGVEFGAGFAAADMTGSQHNDPFRWENGQVVSDTNHAGGILGGLTTGMPLVFRVAVKPTPSIALPQGTVDLTRGENASLSVPGRHDPCIVPRAVPVVEALAAIALTDLMLEEKGYGTY